ncbi:MAG: tetratricopeptide repeat protein [Planctomycetales bacterium]
MDAHRNRRQQLISQAEGYLELGMVEHALSTIDQLGRSDDLEAHVLFLKGEAFRAARQYKEALKELKRAAKSTPEEIQIWISMGWCYKRTNRTNMAIQSLDQALAIAPGEALIHFNLACYWSLVGNKERALNYLATAFDIDSNYRDLVKDESDLDPIRSDPEFLALTSVLSDR